MSSEEKTRAVGVVADLILRLDNYEPDVGMGMRRSTAIDQALAALGYAKTDVDYHSLTAPRPRR